MLLLFETPAGYALFKVLKEAKLQQPENIWKEFQEPGSASSMYVVKLSMHGGYEIRNVAARRWIVDRFLMRGVRTDDLKPEPQTPNPHQQDQAQGVQAL